MYVHRYLLRDKQYVYIGSQTGIQAGRQTSCTVIKAGKQQGSLTSRQKRSMQNAEQADANKLGPVQTWLGTGR